MVACRLAASSYSTSTMTRLNLAVDEFLADKPEKPVVIQMDNYEKYYIQKDA